MKTADTLAKKPDDWPFEVRDVDAVLAQIEHKAKRRKSVRRRIGGGASLAVAAILLGVWAVPFVRDTSSVTTLAAHRQELSLSDGSHADLNAQTSLHTDFRYGRRIVRLDQGEAFFSVAKDPAHPFLVETPFGIVRVTGTHFNVRLIGDQTEVTLLEGSVTMLGQDGTEVARLTPGEQLTTDQTSPQKLNAAALENATAWRDGRLALDGGTLADAVARLAAYHGKRIDVVPEVANLRTGGNVSLDDLGAALAALQETLPIRVLPVENGNYRVGRR